MNAETLAALERLAEKLGTTAERVFAILIKQAQVVIWIDIMQLLLAVVCFTTAAIFLRKGLDEQEDWMTALGGIATAVAGVFLLLCLLINVSEITTAIVNPEYWALDQILRARK